jgi:hypothetical protein
VEQLRFFMRIYYLIILLSFVASCGGREQSPRSADAVDSSSGSILPSVAKPQITEKYILRDSQLVEYKQFIGQLNPSNIDDIQKATEKFKELFADRPKEIGDSAVYVFLAFYSHVLEKANESHEADTTNYDALVVASYDGEPLKISEKLAEYSSRLVRNGFDVQMTEGITYVGQDRDYIQKHFYPYLTPLMISYLTQLNKENKEGFWEDGGLVVQPETLIDRIIWWEKFNKSNPDFIYKEVPRDRQRIYTSSLITGEDNTPLFYETAQSLDGYYKTAYDYLFKTYPETETARLLRPYYSALIKLDTAAIRKFQQEMAKSE